jgi:hypothetical protein
MAKTKKKRRRKRRGTQGGAISTRPAARPRNRQEARARARQRQASPKSKGSKGGKGADAGQRGVPSPPSWKGAFSKGGLAAVLFFALFAGLFHRPIAASAALAAFTLAFYVPLSYYLDGYMYRRHQAKAQAAYEQAKQPKKGDDDG